LTAAAAEHGHSQAGCAGKCRALNYCCQASCQGLQYDYTHPLQLLRVKPSSMNHAACIVVPTTRPPTTIKTAAAQQRGSCCSVLSVRQIKSHPMPCCSTVKLYRQPQRDWFWRCCLLLGVRPASKTRAGHRQDRLCSCFPAAQTRIKRFCTHLGVRCSLLDTATCLAVPSSSHDTTCIPCLIVVSFGHLTETYNLLCLDTSPTQTNCSLQRKGSQIKPMVLDCFW
jgi:hypothetical protein